jgi:hypothetical protein
MKLNFGSVNFFNFSWIKLAHDSFLWWVCGDGEDSSNFVTKVGFEVLTAVVVKLDIFWDIVPCILYVN